MATIDFSEKIIPIFIEEEMRHSYLDYSMSVIVQRALPDVRDGLKPVHRRVLYGMLDLGVRPNAPYKKSARIVGEVLGKYHPHGDAAVYDTMVRMVQNFSLRYPLIDGQGNFGSVDGDSPAAIRYTEARLAPIAEEVLRDIDKDTVDFVMNFDESLKEPTVLPSLLPLLLINGAAGIAVGMATNIPPHNLNEVVDAISALIRNPRIKDETLMKYIQGPDFPTGAIIYDDGGIEEYFRSGRGRLTVRARASVEKISNERQRIIITEIPYQINKKSLIERIADLAHSKKIEDISDVRDESDRDGMRIVVELKRDVKPENTLKYLYKYTQMQTTFGVILLALSDGQPKIMSMKQMLQAFIDFRHDVVLQRTKFELDKAEKRAHILEGLKIALDNIDEIIAIIKKSRNPDTARITLIKKFKLSEIQAQAILDMRLHRLTGLERKKIEDEYLHIIKYIQKLKSLLDNKNLRMDLVRSELLEIKEKYGDERRTRIIGKTKQIDIKDMLVEEKVVVNLTHLGYVNRIPLSKNNIGIKERQNEYGIIINSVQASNNDHILIFTNIGKCHWLRVGDVPQNNFSDNWVSIKKLVNFIDNEIVVSSFKVEEFSKNFVFMCTRFGMVKKIALSELSRPRKEGLLAITLHEKDELMSAVFTDGEQDIIIGTRNGFAVRFEENQVRSMGRLAAGVRGLTLTEKDVVVDMVVVDKKRNTVLSVAENGFGKRSDISQYPRTNRGAKGVINYKIAEKTGRVVALKCAHNSDRFVLITKKGVAKKLYAKKVQIMGRNSFGNQIAKIRQGDQILKAYLISTTE